MGKKILANLRATVTASRCDSEAEGFFSGQCLLPALEPLRSETHPSSPAMLIGCFIKRPTQCLVRMRTSHTHLPSQYLS